MAENKNDAEAGEVDCENCNIVAQGSGQVNSGARMTPEKIAKTVSALNELQAQMNDMFPERETLIQQFVYALLTREHVLVFGTFGTAKSLMIGRFFV